MFNFHCVYYVGSLLRQKLNLVKKQLMEKLDGNFPIYGSCISMVAVMGRHAPSHPARHCHWGIQWSWFVRPAYIHYDGELDCGGV